MRSSALRLMAGTALTCAFLAGCSESNEADEDSNGGGRSGIGGSNASGQAGRAESGAGSGAAGATAGANAEGGPAGAASGGAGETGGAGGTAGTTGGSGPVGGGGSAGVGNEAGAGSGGTAESGGTNAGAGGSAAGGGAPNGGAAGAGTATASEGCGSTSAPPSATYTIDVSGTEREYIVKVPDAYDADRPYRLIFAFHGRMYDAESVHSGGPPGSGPYYGIEAEANGSAIFVAPQALETSWTNADDRDGAYVDAMLERLTSEYCIDESRVFAVGFSMGAIMTTTLGCSRPAVFRAIAPMSGSTPNGTMLPGGCSAEPLPYWTSHGLQDGTITPAQGEAVRDLFVEKNGCEGGSVPAEPEGCVAFEGCDAGYPVIWCTFEGEHEPAPFAGAAIWDFFSQF